MPLWLTSFDVNGIRLLATSLMLNGIAMEVCGSSRPASGSEHLISHALDEISSAPKLHGIQVGVATYLVSLLQGLEIAAIDRLFELTGFWQAVYSDPFSRADWLKAIQLAPQSSLTSLPSLQLAMSCRKQKHC